MGIFDTGSGRKVRSLKHSKDRNPTVQEGFPDNSEGRNGDVTYRKIGKGLVQYIKQDDVCVRLTSTAGANTDVTIQAEDDLEGLSYQGTQY